MARPQEYTTEQFIEVLNLMGVEGITLKKAAERFGIAYSTVKLRIAADDGLSALYARAREEFAQEMVSRMMEIAETQEDVQRARLMCDNIKWYAARVLPKQFGDRQEIEHTGKAFERALPDSIETARRVAFMLEDVSRKLEVTQVH